MKHKSGLMQIRAFPYECKAVDEKGRFTGYGSVFGTVDSYNEVVAPGAFLEAIDDTKSHGRTFPVLWQHRTADPIGNWDIETLKEDPRGLIGEADLWLEEAPYARIAHRGMKTKSVTGLSIGYYVRESNFDEKTRIRTLTKLDLVEISIVTMPANDDARIDAVKSKLAHGSLPTLPEFEQLLREAGFSKSQSAVIANRGLKHLLNRGEPGGGDTGEIAELLSGFRLPQF